MADARLIFDTAINTAGVEKGLSNIGGLIKTGFTVGATAIAATTAAIGALSVKALLLGGDLEQSVGGIETLFKGSASAVIANAEKAYLTAGVSANDYMQQVTSFSASLLQSLGGDTEKAAAVADMAIRDMADNANKMGTSIEMIQNAYQGFAKQNYMMLDNLKLGYGGTKTEMEQLLSDAEKLSGTKYDISNLSDVYQAINVIQTELGITGTTAKEGMETFTGSLATAKAAMANFLSGAGDTSAVVSSFSNMADIIVDRVKTLAPRLASGLSDIFKQLSPKIPEMVSALLPSVTQGATTLIIGVAKEIPKLIPIVATAAKDVGTAILTAIFGEDILPHWNKFSADIIANFRTFSNVVGAILKPVGAALEGMFKFILDNSGLIIAAFVGIKTAMLAMAISNIITGLAATWNIATAAMLAHEVVAGGSLVLSGLLRVALAAQGAAALLLSGNITVAGAATAVLTAAQSALNAVMLANPFILTAAAIGALVGGVILLSGAANKANEESKRFAEETDIMIAKTKELQSAIDQSGKAFQDRQANIEAETAISHDLAREIESLSTAHAKEGESAQEAANRKALLASKVNELNTIMPELNLYYSQENDLLSMTTGEINNQITARQRLIQQKAYEERQIEVTKELYELEKEIPAMLQKNKEAYAAWESSTEGITDTVAQSFDNLFFGLTKFNGGQRDLAEATNKSKTEYDGLLARQSALNAEMEELNNRFIGTTKSTEVNTGAIASNANALVELKRKAMEISKTYTKQSDVISEMASGLEAAEKAYSDVSQAQSISMSTAADLTAEYSNLIANNADLLAQYPNLYAALDENNTVQENGKAIALAVWQIKKQLLIEEQKATLLTMQSNIEARKAEVEAAIQNSIAISKAAMLSNEATALAAGSAAQSSQRAIEDAKRQAAAIAASIKSLEAMEMPTVEVKTSGVSSAKKEIVDAFKVAKEAISDYADTEKATVQGQIERWEALQKDYAENSKERIEIDKNIRNLKATSDKQTYETSKKWIDEEKRYNRLSLDDELAKLQEMQSEHADNADMLTEINYEMYRVRNEQIKEAEEVEKEALQKRIDILDDIKYKEATIKTEMRDLTVSLIDDETIAKIAGVDEGLAAFLSAKNEEKQAIIDNIALTDAETAKSLRDIENQKSAIKALQEADKERIRTAREEKERSKLTEDIAKAETPEATEKAYQALAEFEETKKQERIDKEREQDLKALDQKEKDTLEAAKKRIEAETALLTELTKEQQTQLNNVKTGLKTDQENIGKTIIAPIKEEIEAESVTLQESGKVVSESIAKGITDNVALMAQPATKVIETTVQEMKNNFDKLKPFTRDLYSEMRSSMNDQPWQDLGHNMIMGMVNGVYSAMQPFIDAVEAVIAAGLEASRAELDMHSPSRVTWKDGINLVMGWVGGVLEAKPKLTTVVGGLTSDMLSLSLLELSNARYQTQGQLATAGVSGGVVNNYYSVYPQKMTYTDMNEFTGELSRAIAKRGV